MLSRRSFKGEQSLTVNDSPISIALGENKLTLQEDGKWLLESSDMQKATAEVLKASQEKENLIHYLKDSYSHIEAMKKEILELKEMKANLLDLVSIISRRMYYFFHFILLHPGITVNDKIIID